MEAKIKNYYTYEDWMSWDESVRAEIVDGEMFMMAYPVLDHERLVREIFVRIYAFLKGKPCEVFPSNIGVRLNENEDTVVAPDISVVCDKSKLENGKICIGAPDMVVEVLSPGTEKMDRVIKRGKYLEAGVREYWIVNPDLRFVDVLILNNGIVESITYTDSSTIPVHVLDGLFIDLQEIFPSEEQDAENP